MTPLDPARVLEHVHGHLAWLSAAALLHPAIVLRRTRRRAHLAVALPTLLVTAVGAAGVAIYGPYRDRLRQQIFIHAPRVGYLFERKEHLAFGAVLLAWAGAFAYAGALAARDPARESLRRTAHLAFILAAALTIVTAAMGVIIAVYKTF